MNICVVGTGYVGLVTGAVFADLGNDVLCVDNQPEKVAALQAGKMPIYEPGLEEMVGRNVADARLAFTTDLAAAVRRALIIFITVGTPPKADGETDLGAVEQVAAAIGRAMEKYTVIVNKSTVPVGTGDFVRDVIARHQRQRVPFDVVSNPEFLREGSAIEVNRERAEHFVAMNTKALSPLDDRVIAVLGLAFKPNTDDMREAKSVEVIRRLRGFGARIRAYDPVAIPNARRELPADVTYCDSAYEAATGADALALVTEWNEFKFLNLERVRALMRRPVVFDGRNAWEPERMRRLGFEYHSIGRRSVLPA